MFNKRTLLMAALVACATMTPAAHVAVATRPIANVSAKRKKGLFNGMLYPAIDMLPGRRFSPETVATAKRRARKARNQRRHKRTQRG